MLVVDLHCAQGHHFEGWFASADDLAGQRARGLLSCPVCGVHEVERRPSAPRLNVSALKADRLGVPPAAVPAALHAQPVRPGEPGTAPDVATAPEQAQAAAVQALQAQYLQAVRQVLAHTEDVGERFVEEVRGMHHGDLPERAIRGQATPDERRALAEEGIEVMSLPIPEALKGPLQ